MRNSIELIQSGILELYILGLTSAEETREIEEMAAVHADVRDALNTLGNDLEQNLMEQAVEPPLLVKPFLMAILDYMGRMEAGEAPEAPPILGEHTKVSDYTRWLERPDMALPQESDGIFAKIIGYTPEAITAIAWLKDFAPDEVHDNQSERFFIIEGSCNIIINETEVYPLYPGDYLAIPLHAHHRVNVTSEVPCKVILQRVAV